ncbi:MAG: prephenate dehydrogenase [Flavobacteriaceae bacterium]|nr:MAG: prephenate dehydrogenase [Flavobacteriaceae bacterium]
MMRIVVIGLGLIGGSMALDLKKRVPSEIIGVDVSDAHAETALDKGVIDRIGSIGDVKEADTVIVAVPVNLTAKVVSEVLDLIGENTLVFDVGSVKESICKDLSTHLRRKNFVAAHPIAGTEFSGPDAAIHGLFDEKVNILCETEKSDWKILDKALSLFKLLNMRIKMMHPGEHDRHIAYVSHLSHVSSFMLGKTVLEIERSEEHIFDMAGSGFASTVRLAKSSPATWTPIFMGNKDNLLASLDGFIKNLNEFRAIIEQEDTVELSKIMEDTNYIKKVLSGIQEDAEV